MISRFTNICLLSLLLSLQGCALLGVAANAIPQNTQAKYSGLEGKSVGIIVWADRGILIDWGALQIDLANSVQAKLIASEAEEMKAVSWPYPPASYVRYMRDHPQMSSQPISDIAPRLGVQRLIYIEVHEFRTRSQLTVELFRGEANASLQIVEVDAAGAGKVAFSEDDLHVVFPRSSPVEGEFGLGDGRVYTGTVDALANEIAKQLVTHASDAK